MWHFVKFCGSLWQITVNSTVASQLKENQLCCSKYPIYCLLLVLMSHHMRWLRWQTKPVSNNHLWASTKLYWQMQRSVNNLPKVSDLLGSSGQLGVKTSASWCPMLYQLHHPPCYLIQSQLRMWQSSNLNSTTFELGMFLTDMKFVECFKRLVFECEFMEKSLFYDWFLMHSKKSTAARERRQTFL